MEANNLINMLRSAVEEFDIAFAVLADRDGSEVKVVNEEKMEEFRSLYNASFFDSAVIRSLYENLKVSILPQIVSQADKFCYLGLLDDRYLYGVFGKTEKGAKEQYFYSKEIDKFLHLCR